jgi:hypothetical protein
MTIKAKASPSKEFFVNMITKDISLEDCILDLIDNSIDGARKLKLQNNEPLSDYAKYFAKIYFNESTFSINDNCGGITVADAENYAFHFGRKKSDKDDGDFSIGLYGIGMKRAIFKIGKTINILSMPKDDGFETTIKVDEWINRAPLIVDGRNIEDWDFEINRISTNTPNGTKINVTELYNEISNEFKNPEFSISLIRIISRDYSQYLNKGFEIYINDLKVDGHKFFIQESKDFAPVKIAYKEENDVEVKIIAGMLSPPPDDLNANESKRKETDYNGWYVLCNDRVVIASDKTDLTVWGNNFPVWHYQYNGFIGLVSFESKDPAFLPWKTTKRDVDQGNLIYRRAIEKMKIASRAWIDYTNERKADLELAKQRELSAKPVNLFDTADNAKLVLPTFTIDKVRVRTSSIQYSKTVTAIEKAKKLLGNSRMTNSSLGEKTFEYFLRNEDEDEDY